MAWIAADLDGDVYIYPQKPIRKDNSFWYSKGGGAESFSRQLCNMIIGYIPTWKNDPIEITQAPSKGEG